MKNWTHSIRQSTDLWKTALIPGSNNLKIDGSFYESSLWQDSYVVKSSLLFKNPREIRNPIFSGVGQFCMKRVLQGNKIILPAVRHPRFYFRSPNIVRTKK